MMIAAIARTLMLPTLLVASALDTPPPPAPKAMAGSQDPRVSKALTAFAHGRYLEANDALATLAFAPDGTLLDDFTVQMWEQISPTLTNELDPAVIARLGHDVTPDPSWATRLAAATPRDALSEIARRAAGARVVILNEAHVSPRDRAFALEVARTLRPLGYTILAAEVFNNDPPPVGHRVAVEQLRQDGFVRLNTGFYTRDPVFAGFVRQALALGYAPAAYEQTASQRGDGHGGIAVREAAEAENLAAVLARDPKARVLVYVGQSHVAEAPIPGGGGRAITWMAARLKATTGIDPLTIDQTTITDLSSASRPAWTVAAARIGAHAAVFFEGDRPLVLGQYAGAVDLQVVHPARSYRYGRPAWLATMGLAPYAIPDELLPEQGRRLVQAFAANAPDDAVPLDQVVVQAGVAPPMLMLPPGKVRFATQP